MNVRYSFAVLAALALAGQVAGAHAQEAITAPASDPPAPGACVVETMSLSGTGQCGLTTFRAVQNVAWQRILCATETGPGSGGQCPDLGFRDPGSRNPGGADWPAECPGSFPGSGAGLLPTGTEGYHAPAWGNGATAGGRHPALLLNSRALDAIMPFPSHWFDDNVSATAWPEGAVPQEGARWHVENCTLIESWPDMVVTGPRQHVFRR